MDVSLSPDRNKTELTLRVTEAASSWLLGLGAKAIETEVFAGKGWVADLAAFWIPTPTEAIESKIISKKPKYYYGDDPFKTKLSDDEYARWKAQYESLPTHITIVHEVKTSRQDFKRDDKFTRPPVADMQVLSFSRGILSGDEFPAGWWVLEHADTGKLLAVRQRGVLNNVSIQQRLGLIGCIADRRHNRTANAFFKEIQKRHSIDSMDRKIQSRVSGCMRAVLSILKGEYPTVEITLERHFNNKFPVYLLKELSGLHGILKSREGE